MKHQMPAALLVGAIVGLSVGQAAWATTPISGNLNVVANVNLGATPNSNLSNQSWTTTPTALAASASATVNVGADNATAQGIADAFWAPSGNQGAVLFEEYGWEFNDAAASPAEADLVVGRSGPDWSYTFTATQSGFLTMNYHVGPYTTDTAGLGGWQINCSCGGSGGPVLNSTATASGTFTADLVAGTTYMIALTDNANAGTQGTFGSLTEGMNGYFSWAITPIPEPSTWAMLVIGFGGVAFAGYRRRAGIAAA